MSLTDQEYLDSRYIFVRLHHNVINIVDNFATVCIRAIVSAGSGG